MRQRVREGRQQHLARLDAGEMGGAMQRDDGLASAGRARDARGTGEVARDQRRLRGMQEDGPFLPRLVERAAQRLDVAEGAEATERVGMQERVVGRRSNAVRFVSRNASAAMLAGASALPASRRPPA